MEDTVTGPQERMGHSDIGVGSTGKQNFERMYRRWREKHACKAGLWSTVNTIARPNAGYRLRHTFSLGQDSDLRVPTSLETRHMAAGLGN